jgi:galactokinase
MEASGSISHGIEIDNYRTTLPMRKGLSSSAAVCVLVVRAFAAVWGLELSTQQVMELAFKGEMRTPSRCGRMDQCVAIGPGKIARMNFDGDKCSVQPIFCKTTLYFVVADLNRSKDTLEILRSLNSCFPVARNETEVRENAGRTIVT